MDEFLKMALEKIKKNFSIESIPLPENLKQIKLPLGLIEILCYNWKAAKIRKIYSFRLKATFSLLDIIVIGIYPEPTVDLPIFDCEFNGMRKRVFPVINFVPLFNHSSYLKKYIEPMKPVFEKYSHFSRAQVIEYLKPYLSPYCIFTKTDKTHLEEIKRCGMDYLTLYLDLLSQAEEVEDISYRDEVERAQKKYTHDLITHDPSRKMLGRIIGKKRADRIFKEIIV
jgi:15,16-dihydrobiliverdin:ferredoxin oxidoreductase